MNYENDPFSYENECEEQTDHDQFVSFLNQTASNGFNTDEQDNPNGNMFEIHRGNSAIYPQSDITLSEFVVLFLKLVYRLRLPVVAINLLLFFLKTFLPRDSIIPSSYYQLIKLLDLSHLKNIKRQYVCVMCNSLLEKNEKCYNGECMAFKRAKKNIAKSDPFFIQHNYLEDFKKVMAKNWPKVLEYRQNYVKEVCITDICNAEAFVKSSQISINSVSLILFVDEASFSKSSVGNKMYFVLAQIMDLPIRERNSYYNLIRFITWGGYIHDFNNVLRFVNPTLDSFFSNEIFIDALQMSLRVN